jgi:hypothetical protein
VADWDGIGLEVDLQGWLDDEDEDEYTDEEEDYEVSGRMCTKEVCLIVVGSRRTQYTPPVFGGVADWDGIGLEVDLQGWLDDEDEDEYTDEEEEYEVSGRMRIKGVPPALFEKEQRKVATGTSWQQAKLLPQGGGAAAAHEPVACMLGRHWAGGGPAGLA